MDFIEACTDEVALEGLEGTTFDLLIARLRCRVPPITVELNDAAQNFIWQVLVSTPDLKFYKLPEARDGQVERLSAAAETILQAYAIASQVDRQCYRDLLLYSYSPIRDGDICGSCSTYHTRQDISDEVRKLSRVDAQQIYGNSLCIVASQRRRELALLGGATWAHFNALRQRISDDMLRVMEAVGRGRQFGFLAIGCDSNDVQVVLRSRIAHVVQKLINNGLVTRHTFDARYGYSTSTTYLLFLSRIRIALVPAGAYRLETVCDFMSRYRLGSQKQKQKQKSRKKSSTAKRLKLSEANNDAEQPETQQEDTGSAVAVAAAVDPSAPPRVNWVAIRTHLRDSMLRLSGRSEKTYSLKRLREYFHRFNVDETGRPVYVRVTMVKRTRIGLESEKDNELEVRDDFDEEVETLIGPVNVTFTMLRHFRYFEWLLSRRDAGNIGNATVNDGAESDSDNESDAESATEDNAAASNEAAVRGLVDPLSADDGWSNRNFPIINRLSLLICEHSRRDPNGVGVDRLVIRRSLHLSARDCPTLINRLVQQGLFRVNYVERGRQKLYTYLPNFVELPFESDTKDEDNRRHRALNLATVGEQTVVLSGLERQVREIFRKVVDPDQKPFDTSFSVAANDTMEYEEAVAADDIVVEEVQLPVSMEVDVVEVDANSSMLDTKPEFETSKKRRPVVVSLTERFHKRAGWIEQIVNEAGIVANLYQLRNMVRQHDEQDGYTNQLDQRSLLRILTYLADQGRLRLVDFPLPIPAKNSLQLVVSPGLDVQSEAFSKMVLSLPFVVEQINCHQRATSFKRVRVPAVKKQPPPVDAPSSRAVRWMYGFRPRMRRLQILHEFLFYLVYSYEGSPQPPVDDVSPVVYVDQYSCWKRYVAPLSSAEHDGCFLTSEVLRLLPLSVFCAILPLSTPSDELLAWLHDPDRRHYPVLALPQHLFAIVHRKSDDHQRRFVELLKELSLLSLVTFVSQADVVDEENATDELNVPLRRGRYRKIVATPTTNKCAPLIQLYPYAYLNRKASLLNTFSVTLRKPGPDGLMFGEAPEQNFPRIDYEFTRDSDLIRYWNTLVRLSFRSGVQLAVSSPTRSHNESGAGLKRSRDLLTKQMREHLAVYPVTEIVDGRLPAGNKQGCAGVDSRFFLHSLRAWYVPRVLQRDKLVAAGIRLEAYAGQRHVKPIQIVSLIDETLVSNDEHAFNLSRFYQSDFRRRSKISSDAKRSRSNAVDDETEMANEFAEAGGKTTGSRTRRPNASSLIESERRGSKAKARSVGRFRLTKPKKSVNSADASRRRCKDRLDREIINKVGNGRSRWTIEQRKSCLLFRAASMLMFGVCNPRLRIGVPGRVLRDLLHSWHPEAMRDKTTDTVRNACRWTFISKATKNSLRRTLSSMYSEALSDDHVKQNYFGKFPNANSPLTPDRIPMFIELCEYLRNGLRSIRANAHLKRASRSDSEDEQQLAKEQSVSRRLLPRSLSELRLRYDVNFTALAATRKSDAFGSYGLPRVRLHVTTCEDHWVDGKPTEQDARELSFSNLLLSIGVADLMVLERISISLEPDQSDRSRQSAEAHTSVAGDRPVTQCAAEESFWLTTVQQYSTLLESVRDRLVSRLAMRKPRYNDTAIMQYIAVQRAAARGALDSQSKPCRMLLRNRAILRGWLVTQPFRRWFLNECAGSPNVLFDQTVALIDSVRLLDDAQRVQTAVPFTTRSIFELDPARFVAQFIHCAFVLMRQHVQGSLTGRVGLNICAFDPIRVPRVLLQLDNMGKSGRGDANEGIDATNTGADHDAEQSEMEEEVADLEERETAQTPKRNFTGFNPYFGSLYKCHIHRCSCVPQYASVPETSSVAPFRSVIELPCAKDMISLRSVTDTDVFIEPKPCFVAARIPASSFVPGGVETLERAASWLTCVYTDAEIQEASLSGGHFDVTTMSNTDVPDVPRFVLNETFCAVYNSGVSGATFAELHGHLQSDLQGRGKPVDARALELCLQFLTKTHLVVLVGGYDYRFVALAHAKCWLLVCNCSSTSPDYFVPKLYLDADGSVQSDVLCELLKTTLWHIMNAPGVTLKTLASRYEPMVPRVALLDLLQILQQTHCVTVTAMKSQSSPCGVLPLSAPRRSFVAERLEASDSLFGAFSLLSSKSPRNILFEATPDCVLRLAFFVRYLTDRCA